MSGEKQALDSPQGPKESPFSFRPSHGWRWLRRFTQVLAIVAIFIAPVLGGWQRLERNHLASWQAPGAELPQVLLDRLSRGAAPREAYESLYLVGGGMAVEYFSIPIADPLAGTLALMTSGANQRTLVALLLPVLLAAFAGRVFCGWFCPFGVLARALRRFTDLFPKWPRFAIPERRPIRWVLMGLSILAGLFGVHLLLFLLLPHLLVQQAIYTEWLLGGGGAVLGILLGLILASLALGPTTYCAALCPTGASLALLGKARVIRLQILDAPSCAASCRRCDQACWLDLQPASGDPGSDCDLCARCVPVCPKTNLRIGLGKGSQKEGYTRFFKKKAKAAKSAASKVATIALISTMGLVGLSSDAFAREGLQPALVLDADRVIEGVTLALSVVDISGMRLAADSPVHLRGIELSVFVARGERGEPDERGLIPSRDVYRGPLTVRIHREGRESESVEFAEPNSPASTPRRAIYRENLEELRLHPGDRVEVLPIEGWISEAQSFEVPHDAVDPSALNMLAFMLAGLLSFAGLITLALGLGRRADKSD